jgi:hypothetical protein
MCEEEIKGGGEETIAIPCRREPEDAQSDE